MDEQQRAARLGRAWDTFKRVDLAGCDPKDVTMLRSLIALDDQPAPDRRFVAQLEATLTGPRFGQSSPTQSWTRVQTTRPTRGSDDTLKLPEWTPHRSWTKWAAAGIVALLCGVAVLALLLPGGSTDDRPTAIPAYGDASPAVTSWQATQECDAPARSSDSLRTLVGLSAGTALPTPPPSQTGVPADAETVASVEATMREMLACRNARETGREYALYSDAALLRADQLARATQDFTFLEGLLQSTEFVAGRAGTPEPAPPDEHWTFVSAQDVVVLADGRVRALVTYAVGNPQTEGRPWTLATFFVAQNEAHVIDDAEGFTYPGGAIPSSDPDLIGYPSIGGPSNEAVRNSAGDTDENSTRDEYVTVLVGDSTGGEAGVGSTGAVTTGGNDGISVGLTEWPKGSTGGDTSAGMAMGGATGPSLGSPSTPTPIPTSQAAGD